MDIPIALIYAWSFQPYSMVADGREHDDGYGGRRAGDQVARRTEQGRDDGCHHRRIQTVFRREACNGGKGHALWQYDNRTSEASDQVGPDGFGIDKLKPSQKWE